MDNGTTKGAKGKRKRGEMKKKPKTALMSERLTACSFSFYLGYDWCLLCMRLLFVLFSSSFVLFSWEISLISLNKTVCMEESERATAVAGWGCVQVVSEVGGRTWKRPESWWGVPLVRCPRRQTSDSCCWSLTRTPPPPTPAPRGSARPSAWQHPGASPAFRCAPVHSSSAKPTQINK